jgi:hypothetical protein
METAVWIKKINFSILIIKKNGKILKIEYKQRFLRKKKNYNDLQRWSYWMITKPAPLR